MFVINYMLLNDEATNRTLWEGFFMSPFSEEIKVGKKKRLRMRKEQNLCSQWSGIYWVHASAMPLRI